MLKSCSPKLVPDFNEFFCASRKIVAVEWNGEWFSCVFLKLYRVSYPNSNLTVTFAGSYWAINLDYTYFLYVGWEGTEIYDFENEFCETIITRAGQFLWAGLLRARLGSDI